MNQRYICSFEVLYVEVCMKRLTVFVFYDFEGIVDRYVIFLLLSLMEISDKIVVVVNGEITKKGKKEILNITPFIFQRENIGFDAGAYKDVFLTYLKNEKLDNYDEIIMLNDTFYGPIYPWGEVFSKMNKENVDFWGLSTHAGSKELFYGNIVYEHIQGYFLVCRKNLFTSSMFVSFWENLQYPRALVDAVIDFEIAFTDSFRKKGYLFTSFLDLNRMENLVLDYEIPYFDSYKIMSRAKFPIVKRKALSVFYFAEANKSYKFIDEETKYDISFINEHQRRLDKHKKIVPYGLDDIRLFAGTHKKIYVFGRGIAGKSVRDFLIQEKLMFEKFIVTSNEKKYCDTMELKDIKKISNEDGVILALGLEAFYQVYPKVKLVLEDNQLLCPRYY